MAVLILSVIIFPSIIYGGEGSYFLFFDFFAGFSAASSLLKE